MNCINCGHEVGTQKGQCPTCNIPLDYYGVTEKTIESTVTDEKITGVQCPNCHGIQSDEHAPNCEYCNFPLNGQDRNNKSIEKTSSEPTFAWRQVGQSRFNMQADQMIRRLFDINDSQLNCNTLKTEWL